MKRRAQNTVTNIRPKEKSAVRNGGSPVRPADGARRAKGEARDDA